MAEIVSLISTGDYSKVTRWLERVKESIGKGILDKYGRRGVEALALATPKDTGLTALCWYYEIQNDDGEATLRFCNSNLGNGWCPIAIILQYGHGTGTGGWVEGIDYINPVIRPLFEQLAQEIWKEVNSI